MHLEATRKRAEGMSPVSSAVLLEDGVLEGGSVLRRVDEVAQHPQCGGRKMTTFQHPPQISHFDGRAPRETTT